MPNATVRLFCYCHLEVTLIDTDTCRMIKHVYSMMVIAACIFNACSATAARASHDPLLTGVSNDFLINTKNETALVYNDVSVNENMHLATAFKILRRPGNEVWEHLTPDQYRFFRRTVIQIVLATDMAGHAELLQVILAQQ